MIKKTLLTLIGFMLGMLADASLFQLPRLHQCYDTTYEIMDVVDYYSIMLSRSLNTCEDIIDDNIHLVRRHREIALKNSTLIDQCRIRGIDIRNDEQ